MFLYLFFACSSTNERGNFSVASKKGGAFLDVTVQPQDALISINGLPWRGESLSKGIYQLSIEKEGFYTENRTVSIDDLELLKIDIKLRSNDVPLHFYYPSEESFIVRHGDTSQAFKGSATLQVPVGFVEIETDDGVTLFSDIIREEIHVHRCPKDKAQTSYCVSEISLVSAPYDVAFCSDALWISTFSHNRGLYEYDLVKGSLSHHMDLESSTWIRCINQKLTLLSEKGGLFDYEVQTKKKSLLHTFSHSWLSGFIVHKDNVIALNWYQDKVISWKGETETVIPIVKPKGLYSFQDDFYILGSEPGRIYDSSGAVLWQKSQSQIVKGVFYAPDHEFWLLNANDNEIIRVSMKDSTHEVVFPDGKGKKKDLLVTDTFVVVTEHFSQTGFSLGAGRIKIYHRDSQKLLDEFMTVAAPSKLFMNAKNILAITDISSKKIHIYDLSPLLKK